jgi:hypothetical protein
MNWKRHKFQLAPENQAEGRTKEIFDEIRQALGIPFVNTLFRALASFPEFFDLFWRTAKPAVSTQEFFSFSGRLGAEAYTRMHSYFAVPAFRAEDGEMNATSAAQLEIQEVVDFYHSNYSMLLLLCAALVQAFENPASGSHDGTPVTVLPRLAKKLGLVEEEVAGLPLRKIYDDIRRTLGTPFLETCYLSLGRWPDFLAAYWESLKPLVRTPLYEQNRLALRDSALLLAAELPQTLQLSTTQMEEGGVPRDDISAVAQLADLFLNLLSRQTLNLAFAKIGLEDGARAEVAA